MGQAASASLPSSAVSESLTSAAESSSASLPSSAVSESLTSAAESSSASLPSSAVSESLTLAAESSSASLPSSAVSESLTSAAESSSASLRTLPSSAVSESLTSAAESSSAAPASSSTSQSKYDVFLSFRGPDTRQGIVYELYDQLQNRRGVKTFKDDTDLEVGDPISPTLLAAIEQSRFAIIVLSENYAYSTWCLEELVKICQCMQDNNRVLPLFYRVNPTEVRYQLKSFETAFTKHIKSGRHKAENLQHWRDALTKVANFSGWHTQNYDSERELVNAIVDFVCRKVLPVSIQSTEDFQVFKATKQAMEKVMDALKNDKVTIIGVHGIGGVGKTTLVEHAGQEAQNQGLFNHVIKVVVTQTLDLKKVQGRLADGLGITLNQESEDGRASRLNKEIMRTNKLLIIVDDVWERIELSSIGVPDYNRLQSCSSKVILTTRIWNVCHVMRSDEEITLTVLSDEDSWTLFVKNARRSFEPTNFEDVARKVAGECGCLPIALIAVAKALGDKELVEWERAARRLERSQTANPDDKRVASRCIRLSYDYLQEEEYKSCFLLCCLFPEDYTIDVEVLFRFAIGKGLFRDADTIEEARGTADSVFKHLKNSSLLMEAENTKSVRMHDVIRDTAIQIAQTEYGFLVKAGYGLEDWPQLHEDYYSVISLMGNSIGNLPERLVLPNLQMLVLKENYDYSIKEIPETFFQSADELRVVDLSRSGISLLPQSMSLLTNLRVLHLDDCPQITDVTIVGKLKKLEILSMKHYRLNELLREIGDLTNLRLLDLTRGNIFTIPSGVLSRLNKLEELYMPDGFREWGSKIEEEGEESQETNAGFDEVTGLKNLRVLEVSISNVDCLPMNVKFNPYWVEFDIRIGSFDRMIFGTYEHNSLILILDESHDTISTLPNWFLNVVMKKADKLELVWRQKFIDILSENGNGMLHRLKYLSVSGLPEIMTTPSIPKEPVFKNLEELHLNNVDSGFCVDKLLPGSLVNLKLLKIVDCLNWGNVLLPSKLLQRLRKLEKLFCYRVPGMLYVFVCEGVFDPEPSELRVIQLFHLAALRSICDGPAPPALFQNLRSLSIHRCKLQGSLFTSEVAQYLYQLEDIYLVICPQLTRIIGPNNKKDILPKLKNLTLWRLPKLYSEGAAIDIECPSLVHLYVKDCPHISVSFSDFRSRKPFQLNDELVSRFPIF